MNQYIQNHQSDLQGVIDFFKKDISSIRTGRANPAILDNVLVESYGSKVPLQQVGNISVVDASCMTISPWDKNVLKDIEKGIVEADLGVSPVNEGDKIRISIPQPTEEDRKDRVKKINEKLEQAHVKIRQIRDEIKKSIEQEKTLALSILIISASLFIISFFDNILRTTALQWNFWILLGGWLKMAYLKKI